MAKKMRVRQSALWVLFVSGHADEALGRRALAQALLSSSLLERARAALDER